MPSALSILIVEVAAGDRMLLATVVDRLGYRVITAANGREAVALFDRGRPQLVLMGDALMPLMDGFEATRRIKQLAGDELVPIIFLTSPSENQALARCLEAGGDDFIATPYSPIILQAKVQDLSLVKVNVVDEPLPGLVLGDFALGARPLRPKGWTARFELHPDSLRTANPLPLMLQVFLQIPALRHRAGRIYTVLAELYSNALEHGVLGMDSALKTDAAGFARYYREREQRLADLTTGFVLIDLHICSESAGGSLRIGIRDSGKGFDVERTLTVQPGDTQLGGRGLRLIEQLSDRFYWKPDGRELSVEFLWLAGA